MIDEIRRMRRVADLLITCHCILRDRFDRRAVLLDVFLLIGSLLVAVLALSSAEIRRVILGDIIRTDSAIGLVGLLLFALSVVSIRVDWAHRGALHGEAAKAYASLKLDASQMLGDPASQTQAQFDALQAQFKMIGTHSIPVPEKEFNKLKKKHLMKQAVSRLLDTKPAASLWLTRIKLWWRDNF